MGHWRRIAGQVGAVLLVGLLAVVAARIAHTTNWREEPGIVMAHLREANVSVELVRDDGVSVRRTATTEAAWGIAAPDARPAVGERVTVLIDRDDPTRVRLAVSWLGRFDPVFLAVGVLGSVVALAALFAPSFAHLRTLEDSREDHGFYLRR